MALTQVSRGLLSTSIVDNGNATAITIDSSENVTFSGTVTASEMTVSDTDYIRLRFLNATTFKAGLQVATSTGDMIAGSAVDDLAIRSQANMLFSTGGNAERMRIDSSGNVTTPYQPAFSVRPSSDQSNIARPANTTVLWGTEIFDQGGNFSSNTFTAPVTGRYQLNVNIYAQSVDSAADYVQFALVTSNQTYYYIFSTNTLSQDAAYMSFPIAVLADMDASDTAIVQANLNNTGSAQMDITTISYFSGYLVA